MKKELYFLLSSILLLFSCAEEGPYRLGKMECSIEISTLTSNSACVSVYFPNTSDNMMSGSKNDYYSRIILIDHPITDQKYFDYQSGIQGKKISESENYNECVTVFDELKPNTTYYVLLNRYVYYNGQNGSAEQEYYYPGYSFTTPSEGDYSKIGEASVVSVDAKSGFARVYISLPDGLRFDRYSTAYLEASTSLDMSDAIEVSTKVSNEEQRATFIFSNIKDGKYYLRLRGNIISFSGEVFDQMITLNVKNQIDLSGMDMTESIKCDIDFAGVDFTIFRVSILEFLNLQSVKDIRLRSGQVSLKDIDWYYEKPNCYIYTPRSFVDGNNITVDISGIYSFMNTNFETDLKVKSNYNSDITNIKNPRSNTLFAGADYSLVKIEYPPQLSCKIAQEYYLGDGISFPDSYHSIHSLINSWFYVIVNNSTNTFKDQYLRVKGDFEIQNLNAIHIYGKTINIDGKIGRDEDNHNLFQVSTEKINDDLYIMINTPEEFDIIYNPFIYNTYSPSLTISKDQHTYINSVDCNNDLSTNKKMVFKLGTFGTESLKRGENYTVELEGLYLKYIPDDLLIEYDGLRYQFDWTY